MTSTARFPFAGSFAAALERLRASCRAGAGSSASTPAFAIDNASRRPSRPMVTRLIPTANSLQWPTFSRIVVRPERPPFTPKNSTPSMKLVMLWPSPQTAPMRAARHQRCPMHRGSRAARWSGPETCAARREGDSRDAHHRGRRRGRAAALAWLARRNGKRASAAVDTYRVEPAGQQPSEDAACHRRRCTGPDKSKCLLSPDARSGQLLGGDRRRLRGGHRPDHRPPRLLRPMRQGP